jgi:mannose-6-phosphate isomerase
MISPIKFDADIHRTIWGEEHWLVSAHPTAPSRIKGANGLTLRDIKDDFNILVKVINANQRLSVQVHPNDFTALSTGGEAKTEMWCVLKPGPIFAGLRDGVSQDDIERAVADGSFESLLMRYDTREGECYFIPGGLVHAIGEGTSVFEVQQSSDTTFRLYDWGRVGADGKPRKLHVKEALKAIDMSLKPPVPSANVFCDYFSFEKVSAGKIEGSDKWRVVYTVSSSETVLLPPGASTSVSSESFLVTV